MNAVADFDHLYQLKDAFAGRFFRGSVRIPPGVNPNGLLSGEIPPPEAVRVTAAERGSLADIVWTGQPAVVLISDRLAEAFRAEGFTGWLTYPVSISGADRGFSGLAVTGRCGPIDDSRGEWIHKDDDPGRFLRGLFFDERTWDGSDFFLPAGTLYKIVTERVRDCLKREGVKNYRCERLSDVLTSEVVIRSIPGRTTQ